MFFMSLSKSQKGFTIMEATAGILIFLVAMVGVTVVFQTGGESVLQSRAANVAENLAAKTIDEISHLPFYREYVGTDQDIDDFYYNEGILNRNQLANPGLVIPYDDPRLADYPDCSMSVAVQYQRVDTDTGQLDSPDNWTMVTGWGPKTVGNDEPKDDSAARLRLILVRVQVNYRVEGGNETSITVEDMISDHEIDYAPRIDSITPAGFEVGTSFDMVIQGGGFDDDPADTDVKPDVVITKTGYSEVDVTANVHGATSTSSVLYVNGVVINQSVTPPASIYWDVKVRNSDGKATTQAKALYEIQNPPFITWLDPSQGVDGSTDVTIHGYDFGSHAAGDYVDFNGTQASWPADYPGQVWSNNSIIVTVPTGATTGYVKVHKASTGDSNGVMFTVTSSGVPYLGNIENMESGKSGASGDSGDRVRFYGNGFGNHAEPWILPDSNHYVSFNGTNALTYNFWTDGVIECLVPAGASSGNAWVHYNGSNSNSESFVIPYEPGH